MDFPEPLVRGTLLRRYKRFFAEVTLEGGETVTAHCANSGAMTRCAVVGSPVVLSDRGRDPKRTLRYTWEAVCIDGAWVSVNTMNPNRVVAEAVAAGAIAELTGYGVLRREVVYGQDRRSRIDLLLTQPGRPDAYVEVKSATLRIGERAAFPDAVTVRGQKHLAELTTLAKAGVRAVNFFLVGRGDCRYVTPADEIDPDYGRALRRAAQAGVEVLAYQADVSERGLELGRRLEVRL